MRFRMPWAPDAPDVETRADGYTDALVSALLRTAQGRSSATVAATGALEAAAGIVGRGFMAAELSGPSMMVDGLTAPVLQMVGREIIRRGESVFLIDTSGGALRLLPAHGVQVGGGPFPETWRYNLSIAGPSTTLTYDDVPAASVLHFQYASDPASPWRGVGPLQVAALAGRLSAETIAALADESSGPRGSFLPLPADGGDDSDDDTLRELKADIKTANGSMLTVETTNDDWRQGGTGPQLDWKTERFGPSPPVGMIELLKQSRMEVWNACGLHSALWDAADSAALREAWRMALFSVLSPLGRMLQSELALKLDGGIGVSWDDLRASDLAGRARSFASLVSGGMELERAAALSGLLSGNDD